MSNVSCQYIVFVIFTICLLVNTERPDCLFQDGKYDLSLLDVPGGWGVPNPKKNETKSYYTINICQPLTYPSSGGCVDSMVCKITGDNGTSFGDASDRKKINFAIHSGSQSFTMFLHTKNSCGPDGKSNYRSSITFICGSHLGVPELYLMSDCQVNFRWKTSAACPVKPTIKQVPCYVLDENSEIRDLSPLIRLLGAHRVSTFSPDEVFIISVCSDMTLSNGTLGCPNPSSACRLKNNESVTFGTLSDRLQLTSEGLMLTYRTQMLLPPPGCQLHPKTTILFKCPARNYNQPPKVVSDKYCQYEIVWETEYACPETMLRSDIKTCQFNTSTHGVEIDLSPLKEVTFVHVNSSTNASVHFALSVCHGITQFQCGNNTHWRSFSACMGDEARNTSEVVGSTTGSKLIYADEEVILTYPKGSSCGQDGLYHSTVIIFVCDLDAINDGMGQPRHISSDNCIHQFRWPTKHACLKRPLDVPCAVLFEEKKISLQKLFLGHGKAWQAIDLADKSENYYTNAAYYINVCGSVSDLDGLSECGVQSSACVYHSNGTYINLGSFNTPPTYDPISKSVRLEYTEGSPCSENKFWKSTVDFICAPGHINSQPILTRINEAECVYEFEWHTAEACPQGMINGANCKVYDRNLDINYDLSSLKSKVYEVDSNYTFYLSVCEPLKNSPCSTNHSSNENIGVCQFDSKTNSSHKIGEASSNLSYMDGVVNLTYMSGDPYNDENTTSRMAIIIFICDYNAGAGYPVFAEEANFSYVFHWFTNLVCPREVSVSSECLAVDPSSHLIYDLSSLSMDSGNWTTFISEDGKTIKLYVNVCRSLTKPTVCAENAAACVVESIGETEKVLIPNLGQALFPPIIDSAGHVVLTYSSGDPCIAFGVNTTYTTVIHFVCGDNRWSAEGPVFLSKLGNCEYTLLWTTKYACPTGKVQVTDSCLLTDPESAFTFDLRSLRRNEKPYTVQTQHGTFQLNVCGRISGGCLATQEKAPSDNASVCEVDQAGNMISDIATANSYILSYSASEDLTLKYIADDVEPYQQEVIIRFPCDRGSHEPNPTLLHYEAGYYIFEMRTSLTCIPVQFQCSFVDSKGSMYNLISLSKFGAENWEVVSSPTLEVKFHINFCRPLNQVDGYRCPGGASAACLTSVHDKDTMGFDLGYQAEEPLLTNDGIIVIRYINGSYCENGLRRRTSITLLCDKVEGELYFLAKSNECEYFFTLKTPAACPVKESFGAQCKVIDPMYGQTFDLSPLRRTKSNYNVTVGEYEYLLNVCGQLVNVDGKCASSAACQTKTKDAAFFKSLGMSNNNLTYHDGVIKLTYTSGSGNCHGKYNRSTIITFTCDHGSQNKDGPSFVSEAEDCSYLFNWPTVHACPAFDVVQCSVIDENGIFYDLSKLSLPSDNYYIRSPFSTKKMFVLNVCRTVVNTPDSLCPPNAASCLIEDGNAISLGRVEKGPYVEHGKLKIKLVSGSPCNETMKENPYGIAINWKTIIEFSCDPHQIKSKPLFLGKDDCTYFFDWPTAYACPPKEIPETHDCKVKDPVSGFVYDFGPLQNHLYQVKTSKYQYYFNICGNGTGPCGPRAGVCQEEMDGDPKRFWSAGMLTSDLTFSGFFFILKYTGGDPCHNQQFNRSTYIEFECGEGVGEPKFLFESYDCTYYFSWKTQSACQSERSCAIKNGTQFYDLTSLTGVTFIAGSNLLNDNAHYYISVCTSLPSSLPEGFCPPGSGICTATTPHHNGTQMQSLGLVSYTPFIDFQDHVTIIYTNGSVCESNGNETSRSRIIFFCDSEAAVGGPVLIEKDLDTCMYLFEWRTSFVCPADLEEEDITNCTYVDASRGIYFDLSLLQKKDKPYEVPDEKTGGHFLLRVCSTLGSTNNSHCDGSAACFIEGSSALSYGKEKLQRLNLEGQRLRLTYAGGEDCPFGFAGKRSTEIFFMCDPTAGEGQPTLFKRGTCLVIFMWKTALVCQNMQKQCAFEVAGNLYDFNLLSSLSHNWEASDKQNTFWINLCRGIQQTPETRGCFPTAAVCMKTHEDIHVTIGTIQTMKVKPINSTDLLLTFESQDKRACSNTSTPQSMTPVTRIFMHCGSSLGKPKIFSGPDSKCFFDFVWDSSLACVDRAVVVVPEENGILTDPKFGYTVNISDILNRTFIVDGSSRSDKYVFEINLSGHLGYATDSPCVAAAVCQTKTNTSFYRDVGSFGTRTFIVRGSELHLTFTSSGSRCGKNPSTNVTTIINMQCVSAAGIGSPVLIYESGNCDYVFEWETIAVCPTFHKPSTNDDSKGADPYIEPLQSSHTAAIVIGVLFAVVVTLVVAFFIAKPERRSQVTHRFRAMFGRVQLPYFQYKRSNGERIVLVDASQPFPYDDDDRDVQLLT